MRALVAQPDGRAILRAEGHGSDPSALAHRLVAELLDHGAQSILDSARVAEHLLTSACALLLDCDTLKRCMT